MTSFEIIFTENKDGTIRCSGILKQRNKTKHEFELRRYFIKYLSDEIERLQKPQINKG